MLWEIKNSGLKASIPLNNSERMEWLNKYSENNPKKVIKQIFSEIDPYGEENWDE